MKRAAGALFVSIKTGRVLFNLRAAHKSHALEWGVWGGMMEDNETPKECLIREFSEEMGVIPEIIKYYPFDIYHSRDTEFSFYSFVCVVDNEFCPTLNDESDGYMWAKIGYFPKPLHKGVKISFSNYKALEKLGLIISQHS